MIKRSFFGFSGPRLEYEKIHGQMAEPLEIGVEDKAVLMIEGTYKNADNALIKVGQKVKTCEKLTLYQNSDSYAVSPCTGVVASITPYIGYMGRQYARIEIDAENKEEVDESFGSLEKDLKAAVDFLANTPGSPCLKIFTDQEKTEKTIDTIIVSCIDSDLLSITSQYTALSYIEEIKQGLKILKDITGIANIILAVPKDRVQGYGHIEAKVMGVSTCYPSGNRKKMLKDLTGREVPALKSIEDTSTAFFSAEALVSIARAFNTGKIPLNKLVTVTDKNGNKKLISASVGLPIGEIFKKLDISINDRDRIIFGGLMTGEAVFSEDQPVMPDTDAIIVQDKEDIYTVSDSFCVNCGDCVRVCPAKIQVNCLVRFLDAGQYREAAQNYDLYNCIDCGLCSYVCPAAIPVFQYIQLGKYELMRAEATDEQ